MAGARREEDLGSRPRLADRAALPVGDAGHAVSIAIETQDVGMGLDAQVRAPHRIAQEAGGGAVAPPAADGPLVVGDTLLLGAVIVGVALDAELHRAADESFANPIALGDVPLMYPYA